MPAAFDVEDLIRDPTFGVGPIEGVGNDKAKDDRLALTKCAEDLVEVEGTRPHSRLVDRARDERRHPRRDLDRAIGPGRFHWLPFFGEGRGSTRARCRQSGADEVVTEDGLEARLKTIVAKEKKYEMFIDAKQVSYGTFIRILDAAKGADIRKVHVPAVPQAKGGEPAP